jgi:cobalt-zinc-cadmium resistance protein CzcA
VGGEKRFGVTLRLGEAWRGNLDAARHIPVASPEGGRVPLESLAEVIVAQGRSAINREANSRFSAVKLNVRGRDLGGFVADARSRVARQVKLPRAITWSGAANSRTSSGRCAGWPSSSRSRSS